MKLDNSRSSFAFLPILSIFWMLLWEILKNHNTWWQLAKFSINNLKQMPDLPTFRFMCYSWREWWRHLPVIRKMVWHSIFRAISSVQSETLLSASSSLIFNVLWSTLYLGIRRPWADGAMMSSSFSISTSYEHLPYSYIPSLSRHVLD